MAACLSPEIFREDNGLFQLQMPLALALQEPFRPHHFPEGGPLLPPVEPIVSATLQEPPLWPAQFAVGPLFVVGVEGALMSVPGPLTVFPHPEPVPAEEQVFPLKVSRRLRRPSLKGICVASHFSHQ